MDGRILSSILKTMDTSKRVKFLDNRYQELVTNGNEYDVDNITVFFTDPNTKEKETMTVQDLINFLDDNYYIEDKSDFEFAISTLENWIDDAPGFKSLLYVEDIVENYESVVLKLSKDSTWFNSSIITLSYNDNYKKYIEEVEKLIKYKVDSNKMKIYLNIEHKL